MAVLEHLLDPPRVVVTILNLNGAHLLSTCLDSVLASSWKSFDVLVVDSKSTDGSVQLVRQKYPKVHLLQLADNLGVAGGRNASFAWAREHLPCKWLLFIDNDTTMEPSTIT